ncbi:MAG: DNA recombination protein RmuC [Rhodocyclaceae bacterium]|nr:DNA recombination protein RmuC [Rhodocyclaceae bacterium]MBL0075899.1 DNA recombination protein RmuC [Rhodocyclaceae bacterium]MBP6279989.1 DNA recombination protein RmuC [Rhodocyclaceae bacterium]
MDLMWALVVGVVSLAAGGGLVALALSARTRDLQQRLTQVSDELAKLRDEKSALAIRCASLQTELEKDQIMFAERQATLEAARASFGDAFKIISTDALAKNNQSFLELARASLEAQQTVAKAELEKRQTAIGELVAPVKLSLEKFELQIQGIEKSRVDAYATLTEQVRAMADAQVALRAETGNLVKALRAPQTRGRWGELQLKRVVEMAGMLDHCDFYEQANVTTEDGRLRPDMIVRLPGGKNIVVDAKAPLAAYLEALETNDEEEKKRKLLDHARQVRDHLKKLGQKSYWEQFRPSPDFVVLFLPGETFYSAALEADPALIEAGVDAKVILATPTTLIALLRAVAYGWTQQALTENAERISALGRELYERIAVLGDHWVGVGKNLQDAVSAYNKSVASMEQRVLVTARKFRDLKVAPEGKEIRDLAPIEMLPRDLQAEEFLLAAADTNANSSDKLTS